MPKTVSERQIKKNVLISVAVQAVSLTVGFVLNLVLPKYIPQLQYAHWQTYVLYVGYVGILHFGLLDGIVLRYAQFDYDELDKPRIRSQFKLLLLITAFLSMLSICIAYLVADGISKFIFIYVAIGIITKNLFTYTSYTFQITNRISKYALLIVSQKLFYGVSVIALLFNHIDDFNLYCIADLCGDLFACAIGYLYNRQLYFGKTLSISEAIQEFWVNTSSGIKLLIANWSSILLLGTSKMLVQWHYDAITFARYSFAFSLCNLFLAFVAAVSVVLFPSLKRMDKDKLPLIYDNVRSIISILLIAALLLYYPCFVILSIWMPQYADSLVYWGIMLPMIVYTSKVTLLTNNYLKAYRKELFMLRINVVSALIAFALFAFAVYVCNSINLLLILVVFASMFRSVYSELVVMNILNKSFVKDFIIEAVITMLFIISVCCLPLKLGAISYSIILGIYFILNKKVFSNIKNSIILHK